MKLRLQDSLHYRQAGNTLFAALLLGLLSSLLQIGVDFFHERSRIESSVIQVLKTVQEPAARAAYGLHPDLAQTVINGLFEYQSIHQAVLYDDFGGVLAQAKRQLSEGHFEFLSIRIWGKTSSYEIPLFVDGGKKYVGKIAVNVDNYLIAHNFFHRSQLIIFSAFSFSIILSLLLLFIFSRHLTRPLLKTARSISEISPADPKGKLLRLPKGHEKDELGFLVTTVNEILGRFQENKMQLSESENRYRGLVDNIGIGVALISPDLEILSMNKLMRERYPHFDCSRKTRCYEAFYDPPLGKACVYCPVVETLKDGERHEVEKDIPLGQKTLKAWIVTTPLKNEKGEINGVIYLINDITERKKNELELTKYREHLEDLVKERTEKLRESHERLTTILNSLDAIVYLADMDTGELLFVNSYAEKLFGQVAGKTCWQVLQNGQDGPCSFCTNKYLLDENKNPKKPYVWEFQNTINGRWFHIIDRAIKWFDGRMVRLEIATDITDRKKIEEELVKREKMEATAVLAGGIAHDFNNLLAAIIGYVDLTLDDIGKHHPGAYTLQEALKASRKAQDLTNKFVTFSSGGSPVKKLSSVRDLLEKTIESTLEKDSCTREITFANDLWQVDMDRRQMSQVFKNVLQNAMESMAEDGALRIHAENISFPNGEEIPDESAWDRKFVKITIRDNGKGIPEKIMPNIFDPYFSTKEMGAQKGMGLGLTVALSIVKQHDGYLVVRSEKRGTAVSIYLPA
ncbi:MAG: PAS domain S-box protein [Desulfobulbaceae bacterium]|nr:PAS domain S-box protein [Desulfobulbaceae bacterium]